MWVTMIKQSHSQDSGLQVLSTPRLKKIAISSTSTYTCFSIGIHNKIRDMFLWKWYN